MNSTAPGRRSFTHSSFGKDEVDQEAVPDGRLDGIQRSDQPLDGAAARDRIAVAAAPATVAEVQDDQPGLEEDEAVFLEDGHLPERLQEQR